MSSTSRRRDDLAIDGVLSTQPELGPSIPDGGYGWVVFLATLFFQVIRPRFESEATTLFVARTALVPSLIVSFGIFLAFSKLPNLSETDVGPLLWEDKMIHVPLFFIASWTFFDPVNRALISNSTWPRLVATAGTCLTCAGLLFLWMGMTGYGGSSLFILAGLMSGIGASIQMSQCEILLAQYFRLKHAILAHISQGVTALGFLIAPIIVGHQVLRESLLHVILWYQAVILQGLILNLTFRKPMYLKSKRINNNYNYITTTADDEEDILSKNARELQIKRQDSTGTNVTIEKHEIPNPNRTNSEPGPSQLVRTEAEIETPGSRKHWESFEDEDEENDHKEEVHKYKSLKDDWETFEEDEDVQGIQSSDSKQRKTSERGPIESNSKAKNLQLELAFAENPAAMSNGPTASTLGVPTPLFSDLPINNNNTYSYDVLEQQPESLGRTAVFMPTTVERKFVRSSLEILQQPTFYKSLLLVITTKFSIFVYYTLFPSYLYQELEGMKMRHVSTIMGLLSLSSLLFSGISYWVNIDKKRRPICLWFLCWVGSFGYFMASDSNTEKVLLMGAVQITLSIASLQYVGLPMLGLTLRGETNKEFALISVMSGTAFSFFLFINSSFKDCFRLMALLHFFTGAVWFSNYIYKKLKY
ncbi:hypothetical protein NQ318_023300 [Aromia moschata]|uniref:Uncharacterized protein n=1 Tax=Aromia moschata TaxID=1265417 RepID=A0AAV8XT23_9CUCU|nr:hypothetical protein NQ318_023300 [Aromia moschata]